MKDERLKGKRYINLVRASDAKEGTTSTEAQLQSLRSDCDLLGMIHVDDVVLDGVTGSLPGKRKDLDDLLERKRTRNDFDVIVLQVINRMTRGGCGHLFWFEHECKRVGLLVHYASEDLPDGKYRNLIKAMKADAAQETAISTSQRSTQGSQLALENGRGVTCSHTPYGCWRLYLSADARPSHIIRDLGDGRQEKLHPETKEKIDTYGAIGEGSKGHYRKQKSELVRLMPGDPHEIEIVRKIFRRHFLDGWGGKRISDVLNSRGVPSPEGKQWSQRQVEVVYEQEVYTGVSVGNRTSSAIYHQRSPNSPQVVEVDPMILATVSTMPVRKRPRDEWFIQEHPLMMNFLDPEIRKIAMIAHEDLWRRRCDPDRPKKSKSKHKTSEYLLTGLFYAKQDGEPLVGVLCGPADRRVRYYRHRRGRRGYRKDSVFNRMFPAQKLETAIVAIVQQVLGDVPDLQQRLARFVGEQIHSASRDNSQIDDLRRRREELTRRVNLIAAHFDEENLADAKVQLDRMKAERRSLDEQIAAAESREQMRAVDPAQIVERVSATLAALSSNLSDLPIFALRGLLSQIVERVTGDMETKDVEIVFKLPSWAVWQKDAGSDALRLALTSASPTLHETQQQGGVELGRVRCGYQRDNGSICYECRRIKEAA